MQVSCAFWLGALVFAIRETRRVANSWGVVAGRRGVVLWNELGHGAGVDGLAKNRLPIA